MSCCWLTGDPIANIKLLEDPGKNLVVRMKAGKVYKNTPVMPDVDAGGEHVRF